MFHVEQAERVAHWLRTGAAELGLSLADSAIGLFHKYLTELNKWNEKVNLTALRSDEEIVVRHFLDSLICCKALQISGQTRLLDVGAGAGFPGLPIKIASRSVDLTLLEPSQKKTAFLRHLVGVLGLEGVTVVPARVEQALETPALRPPFSHIVSRALKLQDLIRFVAPLLGDKGLVALWRGPQNVGVGDLDGFMQETVYPYTLPFGHGERYLLVFSKK